MLPHPFMNIFKPVLILTVVAWMTPDLDAKNIDLSTVPTRQAVQLTIYNSEDLTLVRETRRVSFQQGVNPLQFAWANTLIDPTSVELQFLTHPDQLEVTDTTYPHDKPQMLYWNVASRFDGEATIQITYLTSGITWSADYTCIADTDQQRAHLDGYVKVRNNSGEPYENASIRLVVGSINLVEKIATLARVPMSQVKEMDEGRRHDLRLRVAKSVMMRQEGAAGYVADAAEVVREKQIIKEGLSEYFIYTIEGTETIPHGWSKRMRSFQGTTVPIRVEYRYRLGQYGDQLTRLYLMTNDQESGLGTTPLPDGLVRVFRDNGRDGLSYLTARQVPYVPIGDKIELNLGPDPDVVFELTKLRTWRDELWMRLHGANVFRRVGDRRVNIDVRSSVAGWDEHALYAQRIGNLTGRPITVQVRRTYPGDVVFRSGLDPTLHDYQTVQFTARLDPDQQKDLLYEVVHRQGHNAKQNNVTLEQAQVGR